MTGFELGAFLFQPDDVPVQDERKVPPSENVLIEAG